MKGVLFLKKYLCKSYLQRLLAAKQDANSIPFFFHVGLHLKSKCTHVPSNESVKRFVPPWKYLSSGIYWSLVVIWTINQTFQRVVTCQKDFWTSANLQCFRDKSLFSFSEYLRIYQENHTIRVLLFMVSVKRSSEHTCQLLSLEMNVS